ncbi:TPA: hypothetical protein RQJ95_003308 [Vibrio vulnificus]|uniref:hypothetical protein n=1 Tax=Vibrio vulnificus TaxID=672 RepID=UPI001A21E048|nr:hypothetical protein [Vibrio vulnificus]MCJ0818287.1 hypothetical protein [Vibrio vulnificus]HAS6339614.1 hypothetical protein [Vibrio vulnificus]HDY7602210.1 hypothetical protein [Vibrio vulnificus]HDY7730432.1 hypothetical protein [Vibrio vulnificus]
MKKLEFGNYTLKFGNKVLLDMYQDVVLPSFHEMKYLRKRGDTEYFFIDTQVIKLSEEESGEPVVGLCGRIVKNTKLKRDQIFVGESLVEDPQELETAPSSVFLLVLNNHRLIFFKEVAGAPTIDNFRATSEYFLKRRHKEFIQELWEAGKAAREADSSKPRVTKNDLLAQFAWPELRITPLTDRQNLNEFIGRFSQIEKLTIKLVPTNTEINNDDFWRKLEASKNEMNSPSTTISFSNKKEGLSSSEVLRQTVSATALGNSEIRVSGIDTEGGEIKGDNEDFDLTIDVEDIPKDVPNAAAHVYSKFLELAEQGTITLPHLAQGVVDKIGEIYNRL